MDYTIVARVCSILSSRPKRRDRAPSAARGHRCQTLARKFQPSFTQVFKLLVRGKDRLLLARAVVAARVRAAIPPLRQPPVGMTQSLRPAILLSSRPKWSAG